MTSATITVSAATGCGKTTVIEALKQRLELIPGLKIKCFRESVMAEHIDIEYEIAEVGQGVNAFRELMVQQRPWATHPNGIYEYRAQNGSSVYMWADEAEGFGGFEYNVAAAQAQMRRYGESLNEPAKAPPEELPHYWQARTLKEDGRYKIIKVGKRMYAVTETFPGQEDTAQIIHCGTHSNEAHTVFNALTRAYSAGHDAGGDDATDACNELSCKAQAELREALAPVAVTVICNGVTHVFGRTPQDCAQATQATTPSHGMEKAPAASGAPLAEPDAHITDPGTYVWNDIRVYKPVIKDRDVRVDIKYSNGRWDAFGLFAESVDWGDATINVWRYSK